MTEHELVHYSAGAGVGTITLDSPHNRNALSRQLVTELFERLEEAADDDSVRVVVLRSADRVFCSGADLAEAANGSMTEGAGALVELQRTILSHPKPVVTRLAGPVRAGGLGIVAASDLVICAEEVTFALTESRLALAPAVISLTLLPRLTSRAAYDVFLSGRTFDAEEAAAMGLITRSVPSAELDDAVAATCAELARAHPQGLRETKKVLARAMLAHLEAHAEDMIELSARLFGSDEAREAMVAFLTKK
jgi:enoyl-CoA hydratase/carnithine racemase